MAITGPMIVQGENMAFGDIVRHRGGGRKGKSFGFLDREHGVCINASMSVYTSERLNPRHKHDFDQVRYYVRGGENYSKEILGPGHCVYFPEGVPYGPTFTAEGSEENVRLGMQFQGPARRRFSSVSRCRRETRNCWPWGVSSKRDSSSGLTGASRTAPRRFGSIWREQKWTTRSRAMTIISSCIRINTSGEPLDGVGGVAVKHLGYFNEVGPNIKMVRIDAGASTQPGTAPCQQVRYVIEGEITFEGQDYPAISCMYFPAHVPYPATKSTRGATLLVMQLAGLDGHSPPWCLI